MKMWFLPLVSLLMLTRFLISPVQRQQSPVSARQFTLLLHRRQFSLQFIANGKRKQAVVPREWLIPAQEEKDEESSYLTSFNYEKRVSSFPIGNGRLGLHVSSYATLKQGSAQAAAGRDVFLILDPSSSVLARGGIERGVTKQRVRSEGCFTASAERYFIADVNGDGLTDIGVVKEEIQCLKNAGGDAETIAGPSYKENPVTWYVLQDNAWKLDPQFSGKFPDHYQELPLLGMTRSPVAFVGCSLWQTCDRAQWPRAANHP